jgi:hypothetical protein
MVGLRLIFGAPEIECDLVPTLGHFNLEIQ